MSRVAITGVGLVNAAVVGGTDTLARWLDAPAPGGTIALGALIDETESRRLSRVCQLTVAAARLALADAGRAAGAPLGLVVGTEWGDLRSTVEFVDGYLARGPAGLSALLFPNTVMNTMAAATAIAVTARELSLTLNAPTVAGELAIARAAAAVRAGRVEAALAGGVDQLDPLLLETLGALGAGADVRGEGAGFVVLESLPAARRRGARVLGELAGAAWRALPARPDGVGRRAASRAIAGALEEAGVPAGAVGAVYPSASGDGPRDRWERDVIAAALAPHRPPQVSFHPAIGRHSGLGALAVAAAARRAAASGAPGLVHALARGGTHVALVVR